MTATTKTKTDTDTTAAVEVVDTTTSAFSAIPMTSRERSLAEKTWKRVARSQIRNLGRYRDHLPDPVREILADVGAAEAAVAQFRQDLADAEEAATLAAKADAERAAEIARTGTGKFVPTHAEALKRVEAATVLVDAARKRLRTLQRRALDVILENQGAARRALYPLTSTAFRNIEAAAAEFVRVVEENVEDLAAATLADEPESVSASRPPKDIAELVDTVSAVVSAALSREQARRAYVESVIEAGGYDAHDEQERDRERAKRVSEQRQASGF